MAMRIIGLPTTKIHSLSPILLVGAFPTIAFELSKTFHSTPILSSTQNSIINFRPLVSAVMSASSTGDEEPQSPREEGDEELPKLNLLRYLEDTTELIAPFSMTLNEKHRKTMVRTLLGMGKLEFDELVRTTRQEHQWSATLEFCSEALVPLQEIYREKLLENAPNFQEALQNVQKSLRKGGVPSRFFSSLARGRAYQGKLENLLGDTNSELVEKYNQIKNMQNEEDLEVIKWVVQDRKESSQYGDAMMLCLQTEFPPGPSQPADGGRAKGQKGEASLEKVLVERLSNVYNGDGNVKVYTNVGIVPPGTSRKRKPSRTIVESSVALTRSTGEFDAIIAEYDSESRSIRFLEVWEAKASLHPVSLEDILIKKYSSLWKLINDETAEFFVMDRDGQVAFKASVSPESPRLGIFATKALPTPIGLQRLQVSCAEVYLDSSPEIVTTALERGFVRCASSLLQKRLQRLEELTQEIDPLVVLGVTLLQ